MSGIGPRPGAFTDYRLEADRDDTIIPLRLREPAAAVTEGQAQDQEDKVTLEAREASRFWRACLTDRTGRKEIAKLLKLSGAFESSPFAADLSGRQNDRLSDYKMGQMSVGHSFYQWLAIVARDELFALQDEMGVHNNLATRPDKKD